MRQAVLTRLDRSKSETFGWLTADTGDYFFSMERPWEDNKPNTSCIPAGTYACTLSWSPRFGRPLYHIAPVPGRSGIRIHPANLVSQLQGCIALGEKVGYMDGKRALLLSHPAVRRFTELYQGKPLCLIIKEP
jgi:hypothetical protein